MSLIIATFFTSYFVVFPRRISNLISHYLYLLSHLPSSLSPVPYFIVYFVFVCHLIPISGYKGRYDYYPLSQMSYNCLPNIFRLLYNCFQVVIEMSSICFSMSSICLDSTCCVLVVSQLSPKSGLPDVVSHLPSRFTHLLSSCPPLVFPMRFLQI